MVSSDSARQADACRFCWMCRHICPVAHSTGIEGWSPRVRGLLVSMLERNTEYDAEIADTMYRCTLCDACANDCVTGYKPGDFIREARMLAVVEGLAPPAIMQAIETIQTNGNIYGCRDTAAIAAITAGLPDKAPLLLYAGQTAGAVYPYAAKYAAMLMKKCGVNFAMLREEPPSGAFLAEMMGFTGDVQAAAISTAEAVARTGAGTLVALNPADAVILRDEYPKWNLLRDVEIVTATAFFADLVDAGRLKPIKTGLRASLHEPVKLTRGLDEEKPFHRLAAALGIEEVELFLHGKMSRCVGTAVLDQFDPGTVALMVRTRVEDALRMDSHVIVTASPDDFYLMKKYAGSEIRIVDLFDLLCEYCS